MGISWRSATIGTLIDEGVILVHKDGNHGSNYPRTEEFGSEGVPFLTAKLLDDAGNIDLLNAPRLAFEKADKFKFGFIETDDVLLSHNATVGRVAVVPKLDERVLIGTSLTHFRLDNSRLLPRYLAAYFSGREFQNQLAAVMSQTTRNQVPITSQRNLSVVIPPISEQEKIANILASLDDKIELNRQMNQTLEQIVQTIFKSWFVDFEPVKAKIEAKTAGSDPERAAMCAISGKLESELDQLTPEQHQQLAATAALFPDALVESELGLIPKGWEVRGLDHLASLSTKSVSPSSAPNSVFEHYSIPAFDASSQPVYETGKSIKSNKYLVDSSAVLVSKLNPETPRIWYPSVKTARPICSTEFMQFVPKLKADRPFLYLLMKSESMQSEILQRVTGSTGSRQRAQPSQIALLPIVIPECELRLSFCNMAATLLSQIGANLDQSEDLSTLRDVLLPKLLSGEIEIKDEANGN